MIRALPIALVAAIAVALPALTAMSAAPARAEAAGITPDQVVQAEVLSGWRTKDGGRMAGLRLALADGWHTYWRAPGEAGIPPHFDWSGSQNLKSVSIAWPRPEVFDLNGMRSIGYLRGVVLPLRLTPVDPTKPIRLRAAVDIGVCHDICLPATLSVSADLAGAGAPDARIHAALAAQPATPAEARLTAARCAVVPIADGLRLTATLTLPPQGQVETAVFELPDPSIWISEAATTRAGGQLTATADLVPSNGGPFALDRSALTITVLGADGAVELHGCQG